MPVCSTYRGYVDLGSVRGAPVLLLHGSPCRRTPASTWRLAWPVRDIASSCRTCAGTARRAFFAGHPTRRTAVVDRGRHGHASLDALDDATAVLGGFDWGARTVNVIATLWPERCKAMVSVSGYWSAARRPTAGRFHPRRAPVVVPVLFRDRARAGRLRGEHGAIVAKLVWRPASPMGFRRVHVRASALAFDNPDHVAVAIANYRWRLGFAEGETPPRPDRGSARRSSPTFRVPTITLEGDANGAPHPDPSAYARKFSGRYVHRTIGGGVGATFPQEAPDAFARPSSTSTEP